MFGFFKNKTAKEDENPAYIVLQDRWERFLSKIDNRFEESLEQAEEAIFINLNESNYDLAQSMQAWSGIKAQILKLADKIEQTFEEKVKPEMLAYKKEWDLIDEGQKGIRLAESFLTRINRFEIQLEGKVAHKFYHHALKILNENFFCSQCGAQLEICKDIFRSQYVSCDYCNTVNTFTPNSKVNQIRYVIENISKYESLDQWDAMIRAQNEFSTIRSPAEHEDKTEYATLLNQRIRAEESFWEKYFTVRSEYLPEYKDLIKKDVHVKMKYLYEQRKQELGY